SSTTAIRPIPASSSSTRTCRAPASSAFSMSSLTTDAGRSTTSPAAILSATSGGNICTRPGSGAPCSMGSHNIVVQLARQQRLHLGALLDETLAPGLGIRQALALFDPGLGERVDAVQRGGEHHSALDQIEELPEGKAVDLRYA